MIMRALHVSAGIALVALLATAASAEGFRWRGGSGWGGGGMYDTKTVETIRGEVASVAETKADEDSGNGVHLMVKTDAGEISVHLGPVWYIERQDTEIAVGDDVEVTGSRVTYDGQPAILAAEVRMGDAVVMLRDGSGRPMWAAGRRAGAGLPASDPRTPLPLTAMMAAHQLQEMRDHLAAVQEIVAALAADDLAGVAKAARRIGYSDSMAQRCIHMGAAAPGFAGVALGFHRSADAIADAALRGDGKAATAALAATLSTCVGCHAAYRQEIVDEATWQSLTSGAAK